VNDPLAGRSVLVTGGSRGIGAAVASELASVGAAVHVLCRDPGPATAVAEASGGACWTADVADDAEVWTALDALQERLGGAPDAAVLAAGTFALSPLAETSVAMFDRQIAVNLRGAFLVVRALLPAMLERDSGRIVQVGSVSGRRAFRGNAAYGASKFGLRGLHEVLVEELRGTGVGATLLEPAATDTTLWDPLDPDQDPHLPGRGAMLRPEDVAAAVRFVLTRPAHVRIPLLQIERG
jgi:NAD(P)-dependent dehydrogenase (short-subunit alcohol dehydrogenase family)